MRRSKFALRLLPSLADELKRVTGDEGVSINQFIDIAVAEKLAVLRTTDFFAERVKRANPGDMLKGLTSQQPKPRRFVHSPDRNADYRAET